MFDLSLLTNREFISAIHSSKSENTEWLLFFGDEKVPARKTLKAVYQKSTKEVHLLLVLLRFYRRTAARIDFTNNSSLLNLSLHQYIDKHTDNMYTLRARTKFSIMNFSIQSWICLLIHLLRNLLLLINEKLCILNQIFLNLQLYLRTIQIIIIAGWYQIYITAGTIKSFVYVCMACSVPKNFRWENTC